MYKNRKAMTGLETAIILVAFVITAAAFSFVVLNMGFLTSQKTQSVISAGMREASSSMLTDSGIIAEFNNTGGAQSEIDMVKLTFYLKLSQGHEPIDTDPSKLLGTYTNARCHSVIYPSSPDRGQATWTTSDILTVGVLSVTADSATATFSAALYNAKNGWIEGPTPVSAGAILDFAAVVNISTSYIVKITEATELGDYIISDDGTGIPGTGGPITVPTYVMTITTVNGDTDCLLEVGEKFKVTIDFSLLPPETVEPDQSLTPDGVYVHPYEEFRIELRPSQGAVLAIEKQVPAVYSTIMVID